MNRYPHTVERSEAGEWSLAGFSNPTDESGEPPLAYRLFSHEIRDQTELEAVMNRFEGSVRAVAKHYGRDRRQVYRWLKSFGLREE